MIKIIGVSSLSSLNLVAAKPGLVCRLALTTDNSSFVLEAQQTLHRILLSMGERYDISMEKMMLRCPEDAEDAIVYQFCALSILLQNGAKSHVSIIYSGAKKPNGSWDVFVEHEHAAVGRLSLRTAFTIVQMITSGDNDDSNEDTINSHIENQISILKTKYFENSLRYEVRAVFNAADKRQIPWRKIPNTNYYQYGYGYHQQAMKGSILGLERHLPVKLADTKSTASGILAEAGLPVASSRSISSEKQAQEFAEQVGFPAVVKPLSGMRGGGVTPNIQDETQLAKAFTKAIRYYPKIQIEKHIEGEDYRLTIFGGKFVGGFKRANTTLEGDGNRAISEL
ncbi:MAG: ATP-grasp domain-containing protein, partial [Sneathiella sp.]|nr:ATP-grasp domain-containing protein [Sneathiella sp.]